MLLNKYMNKMIEKGIEHRHIVKYFYFSQNCEKRKKKFFGV